MFCLTNQPKEHVQQFFGRGIHHFVQGRIITTEDTKTSASGFLCYIDTPQSLNNSKAKNMWWTSSTKLLSSPKDQCDLPKKTITIVWDPNCYGAIWCLPSKCSLGKSTPPVLFVYQNKKFYCILYILTTSTEIKSDTHLKQKTKHIHYITLHCITLNYITLHYITLQTWHDMTWHDMTIHDNTIQYNTIPYHTIHPYISISYQNQIMHPLL